MTKIKNYKEYKKLGNEFQNLRNQSLSKIVYLMISVLYDAFVLAMVAIVIIKPAITPITNVILLGSTVESQILKALLIISVASLAVILFKRAIELPQEIRELGDKADYTEYKLKSIRG